MKKKLALVLAVLLPLLLLTLPRAAADQPLYFMVVNNTVTTIGPEGPPYGLYMSGEWMMVPLSPLTDASNGLRLHSVWSEQDKRLTIYDGSGAQLTFEYGQGTAFSGSEQYTAPLQRFNARYFVPVDLICEIFGLYRGEETETEWGVMVRISALPLQFEDDEYLRIFRSNIQDAYDEYMRENAPPSPRPGVSSPSPINPSPSSPPSPSAPVLNSVSVYLTFNGAPNASTAPLLDFLEQNDLPALFFLPPESIQSDPALTRRIVALHHAGLLLDVPEGEALLGAIHDGNDLLRETALVKTWFVRTENAPSDSMGYQFWGETVSFSEEETAEDIIKSAEPLLVKTKEPSTVVFSFPHCENVLEALKTLTQLFGEHESELDVILPGELPDV